jgi:hypothetical protein
VFARVNGIANGLQADDSFPGMQLHIQKTEIEEDALLLRRK